MYLVLDYSLDHSHNVTLCILIPKADLFGKKWNVVMLRISKTPFSEVLREKLLFLKEMKCIYFLGKFFLTPLYVDTAWEYDV